MKVLQLSKFFPPVFGGVEQVAWDISDGFDNMYSTPIDVLCVNDKNLNENDGVNYKILRSATIGVLFSTPISFSFINKWRRIRNNYNIIHVHLPNPLAVLALFLFRTEAKIVLHWHSDIVKQKKLLRLFRPLQNWILARADKIIVTSPVYGESSNCLRHVQSKIECIPIGIDERRFDENYTFLSTLQKKYKGKKIVFSLGRLIYYKGFEYLIDAARELPDNIVILIGGKGELLESLRKKIIDNELNHKVVLLGGIPSEALDSYYQLCDVFCLPSIHESEAFGVVQLEAMRHAKPLISTKIPKSGVSWVNQNQETGIVVEPCDSSALAKAIITILQGNNNFGHNAEKRFLTMFTKKLMIHKLHTLYRSL
ncbi:rhamnosyl/mannosyltransferase [Buttiauxella sp. JUb87]|uniref:glycosyltransferase n=1 Tax=Buttiauxella sp. JUb87 TaxID=2485129 RepID=UPI00105F87F7|nr:glycosyltransferase [Buttiauxella sp. JUb87]TDN55094.1 rhamnosyl/mannosyltransferase [Buttiauxella sp. JUb87]